MQELRNLFSLMVGSKRKYVDPSRAVEILKDAFKSSESQQVNFFLPLHIQHLLYTLCWVNISLIRVSVSLAVLLLLLPANIKNFWLLYFFNTLNLPFQHRA